MHPIHRAYLTFAVIALLAMACDPVDQPENSTPAATPDVGPATAASAAPIAPGGSMEKVSGPDPGRSGEDDASSPSLEISSVRAETINTTNLFHEVRFTAGITGQTGESLDTPALVDASLNYAEPATIAEIDSFVATDVSVAYQLGPGDHTVVFRVGESTRSIEFSVPAADLAVQILPHRVIGEQAIEIRVQLTNNGDAAASDVRLFGVWGPAPRQFDGANFIAAFLPELRSGESRVLDVPTRVPSGDFRFEVVASLGTLDHNPADNQSDVYQRVSLMNSDSRKCGRRRLTGMVKLP